MIGLLFSICGTAHTVTALSALEAAREWTVSPVTQAIRTVLVTVEAIHQDALTLLLDGPTAISAEPDLETVRAIRQDAEDIVRGAALPGWDTLGGLSEDPADWPAPGLTDAVVALAARVRAALPGESGTMPATADLLRALVRIDPAPVSRLLAVALAHPPWQEPPPRPLAGWTLADFAQAMRGPHAEAFALRPTWRGAPAETGALARFAAHPLVHDLWTQGAPVAARLAARILGLHHHLDRLCAYMDRSPPQTAPALAARAQEDGPGAGLAAVETARGLLVHRLAESQGRIVDWRITAPTEWTFHPDGALPRAVIGWDASDREALLRRVHLLITAMDPCVTCTPRIEETGLA